MSATLRLGAAVRSVHRCQPSRRSPCANYTSGPTADSLDYVESIESSRLPVLALVLALTFVLLAASFRSVIIPLKAIALNLLSVGVAYGVLVLVFQHGYGAGALGLQQTDTIVPPRGA